MSQYFSRVSYQHLHKELIKTKSKEVQEETLTIERTQILIKYMQEAIDNYAKNNKGTLPE